MQPFRNQKEHFFPKSILELNIKNVLVFNSILEVGKHMHQYDAGKKTLWGAKQAIISNALKIPIKVKKLGQHL